jgi:hypothetical protein
LNRPPAQAGGQDRRTYGAFMCGEWGTMTGGQLCADPASWPHTSTPYVHHVLATEGNPVASSVALALAAATLQGQFNKYWCSGTDWNRTSNSGLGSVHPAFFRLNYGSWECLSFSGGCSRKNTIIRNRPRSSATILSQFAHETSPEV